MIQIQQLKLPVEASEEALRLRCAKELRLAPEDITELIVIRRSVDARKKPELFYIYTIHVRSRQNEEKILKRLRGKHHISQAAPEHYAYGFKTENKSKQAAPVIVGMGPAGLFCAYLLALHGLHPVLLERGRPAKTRMEDVKHFWESGTLLPSSNVQFGEGGAGTFSDGKLNTLVKDKNGRNRFVLETFVKFGAPQEILMDAKPHIGTDLLVEVISNMRREICSLGGEARFLCRVDGLLVKDGKLRGFRAGEEEIFCTDGVLAIGHSARDTFQMLYQAGIFMQAKEFAVGFRIEHPQDFIDVSQYGRQTPLLPAASYKLATKLSGGKGVYSFCMCPGGYVVNASSEKKRLVVNGMSYSGRDSGNANSAIVVSVGSQEFDMKDPLSGVAYQRMLEEKAYALGKGKIPQQLLGDFKALKNSRSYQGVLSKTKGAAVFAPLHTLLSSACRDAFLEGMELFGRKIKGFDRDDAVLSGIESRTSSPVRIVRNDQFYSNVEGLYPCGEGAGYAGGIMSAAMDGLKVAEKILQKYDL